MKTALANGMGTLIYLEVRLQSDSGNINYAGFKADASSNAYVDFITKRGSLEAAAQAMASDIRTAMQTQKLTVSEKAQLMNVLTEIVGDAELAEAYVEVSVPNTDTGAEAYVDSKTGVGDNGGGKIEATRSSTKARQLDGIKDVEIISNAKSIREGLSSRYKTSGNLAIANVNIDGILQRNFYAHSGIDTLNINLEGKVENISLQPEAPMFKATEAPNKNGEIYLRDSCTEYKILNDIANVLGTNFEASGKISLFTELEPCDSCKDIINRFKETYPNIDLEVIHNKDVRIIKKNGY